jgi:Ni,Fe-hydrogenase I small subunit
MAKHNSENSSSHRVKSNKTRKPKTELLKLVCKRAAYMRALYSCSSWTVQISQTESKTVSSKQSSQKKVQSTIKSNTTKCPETPTSSSEGMYILLKIRFYIEEFFFYSK